MAEAIRWLLLPGLIGIGWLVASYRPELARRIAQLPPIAAAAILSCLVLTGIFRGGGPVSELHRWSGHALLILMWFSVPFAVGVPFQRILRHRPAVAFAQFFALSLVVAITLIASFTGYLGPTHVNYVVEESRNRFEVLHLYVLPSIFSALLVEWWWFVRPSRVSPLKNHWKRAAD